MYINQRQKFNLVFSLLSAGFLLFLFFTLRAAHPWIRTAFVGERAPGTWLSSVLLISCGMISIILSMFRKEFFIFIILSLGCFFMALDERFMFHEMFKSFILFDIFDGNHLKMGKWGELFIFFYLASGLTILIIILKKIKENLFRILFIVAIAIGSLSFLFDIFHLNALWEDLFKIFAEYLLLSSLLFLLRGEFISLKKTESNPE